MEATAAFGKKYECADSKARKRFDVMKFVQRVTSRITLALAVKYNRP